MEVIAGAGEPRARLDVEHIPGSVPLYDLGDPGDLWRHDTTLVSLPSAQRSHSLRSYHDTLRVRQALGEDTPAAAGEASDPAVRDLLADRGGAGWRERCEAMIDLKQRETSEALARCEGVALSVPSDVLVFPGAVAVRQIISVEPRLVGGRGGPDRDQVYRWYQSYAESLDILGALHTHVVIRDTHALIVQVRKDVIAALLRASPTPHIAVWARKDIEACTMVTGSYRFPEDPTALLRVSRSRAAPAMRSWVGAPPALSREGVRVQLGAGPARFTQEAGDPGTLSLEGDEVTAEAGGAAISMSFEDLYQRVERGTVRFPGSAVFPGTIRLRSGDFRAVLHMAHPRPRFVHLASAGTAPFLRAQKRPVLAPPRVPPVRFERVPPAGGTPQEYTLHIASHGIDPRVVETSLLSALGVTVFCTVTRGGFTLSVQSEHTLLCEQEGTEPQRLRRAVDTAHFVATPGTRLKGSAFRAKGDQISPGFAPLLKNAGFCVRSFADTDGESVLVAIWKPVMLGMLGCLADRATYNWPGLEITVHEGTDSVLDARRCAPESAYFTAQPPAVRSSTTTVQCPATPRRIELMRLLLDPVASVSTQGGEMRVVPRGEGMMPVVRRLLRQAAEVPEEHLEDAIAVCREQAAASRDTSRQ